MGPYYQDNRSGITLFLADCRDVLPWIARHYDIDLLLADPPYGERAFNRYRTGGTRSHATGANDAMHCEGNDQPFDPMHLLALQAPSILWGANYYAEKLPPSPSWFVWDKRDGTSPDDNADCELAWTNLGGPARIYRHLWRGMIKGSERGEKRKHPNQKPAALMRWCIQRAGLKPGALVVDPYMGSGPIAQAAKELGMRYIGIELVEAYVNAAIGRLQQEVMDLAT